MTNARTALLAGSLLVLAAALLPSAPPASGGTPAPAPGPGLVTLHDGDPVTHTLNLVDGSFGARIEGTVFRETKAHLDFSNYADDALTVALDEDDRGMILDLGHWADIAREREVDEADGGGIVFSSLSVDGADVRIARRHPKDSFQNLLAGRPILSTLGGEHRASIRPALGHVYLVRVEHLHKRAPTVFAKILVVAHRPGESIVLRWEPLPGA